MATPYPVRLAILDDLNHRRGTKKEIASRHGVSPWTVWRIEKGAVATNDVPHDLPPNDATGSGQGDRTPTLHPKEV